MALALLIAPDRRRRLSQWASRARTVLEHPRFVHFAVPILAGLFVWRSICGHLAYQTFSHDFSMIDEALYQTHQGNVMFSSILGRSFFSEHFSPILLLLVPLHRLWTSPYLLLVVQPLALIGAGLLVRRILLAEGHKIWIAHAGLLVWCLNPFVMKSLGYLVHMETLVPLFVFGAFLACSSRRYVWYALLLIGALAIKEDVGLYVAGLGLWIAFSNRQWLAGSLTAVVGLIWTYLTLEWGSIRLSQRIWR